MPRKHHKPEEIVAKLRQVDVFVSQGQNIADAIRQIGVKKRESSFRIVRFAAVFTLVDLSAVWPVDGSSSFCMPRLAQQCVDGHPGFHSGGVAPRGGVRTLEIARQPITARDLSQGETEVFQTTRGGQKSLLLSRVDGPR
jgi:hypothetical protein